MQIILQILKYQQDAARNGGCNFTGWELNQGVNKKNCENRILISTFT